jgi:hypothetical protein
MRAETARLKPCPFKNGFMGQPLQNGLMGAAFSKQIYGTAPLKTDLWTAASKQIYGQLLS